MPVKLKSILATTDLSGNGNRAVARAAGLARKHRIARIRALHVLDQPWLAPQSGTRARHLLRELAADIGRETGVHVEPHVRSGVALRIIAEESRRSDLLVVGASTERAIRDILLGSTAERLLAKTPASILVARNPPRVGYSRVLVALDFSEFDGNALALAQALAPEARLDLIHVFDTHFEGKLRFAGVDAETIDEYRSESQELAARQMRFVAERVPGHSRALVLGGPVASTVLRHGRASNADLIVVGHPKRHWLQDLLMHRIAAKTISDAHSDILVVH